MMSNSYGFESSWWDAGQVYITFMFVACRMYVWVDHPHFLATEVTFLNIYIHIFCCFNLNIHEIKKTQRKSPGNWKFGVIYGMRPGHRIHQSGVTRSNNDKRSTRKAGNYMYNEFLEVLQRWWTARESLSKDLGVLLQSGQVKEGSVVDTLYVALHI